MKLRFGAAVTEARPRMDELGGGSGYKVTGDQGAPPNLKRKADYWTRNGGGNPKLRPWKANTFDLSFEKYFGNQGYVSAAAYYKDLKTYIFNQSSVERFLGRASAHGAAGRPGHLHRLTRTAWACRRSRRMAPADTCKASNSPLDSVRLFSDALQGFGIIASGAKNKSSIKINGEDTPVPGLSRRSSTPPCTTNATASRRV